MLHREGTELLSTTVAVGVAVVMSQRAPTAVSSVIELTDADAAAAELCLHHCSSPSATVVAAALLLLGALSCSAIV
jgi:hypothetical protein